MTVRICVGRLPDNTKKSDLRKLFPKAKKIVLSLTEGKNSGRALLSFPDKVSAAAAVKIGATYQNSQLRVTFRKKSTESKKRSFDSNDDVDPGPKVKKFKGHSDDSSDEDSDTDDSDDDDIQGKMIKKTVAKMIGIGTCTSAQRNLDNHVQQKPRKSILKASPAKSVNTKPKLEPIEVATTVKYSTDTSVQGTTKRQLNKCQLYIDSISENVTVSDIKLLYPEAKSIKLKKRKIGADKKISKYALITFENESTCAEALSSHMKIGGKKVNVSYAFAKRLTNDANKIQKNQSKQDKDNVTSTIYVGQLPENVDESDIKAIFPKSKKIELFQSRTTPQGVRPAFAFVTFHKNKFAAAAIKAGPSLKLNNTQLKIAYQTKRTM